MISAFPKLSAAQKALDAGRYQHAAQLALKHVRANPQDPRGLGLLGTVAMRMGALGQAERFLRQALAQLPDSPQVHRELASCLHQQEKLEEALAEFNRVAEMIPEDSQLRLMTTLILDKLGRADEARDILVDLVERFPESINNWLAYGLNLRAAGRTDESVRAYRRAAMIDPERGDAWWGIASIKENVLTDDDIAVMEEQVGIAIDVKNLSPLHFALARAWHERKEYRKAFHHYSEANRLWAESLDYQPNELTEEIDQAQRLFDRDFFANQTDGGDPSSAPIFIVSLPRSGSTLLEQMLGSHGDVEPLGELPYIPALLRSVMEDATRRGITSVPDAIRVLPPADRTAFGRDYLRRVAVHRRSGAPRFTDKLPHNWSNILFIRQILPNARIIDIRRAPLDCCFSNFTHSFSRAHASSFALKDIGRTYVDYVRFMDHLDQAASGMVQHVRYEELIEAPERELRLIKDYLGLPWDEACLRFYESKRTVRTPSAEQVRRPLNREGVANWKPYAQWLGPLREALGPLAGS
ncbi:MAG TPA: sulfotransferase [Sphingomicrobium sp.]|nr:sulfotransferase [Sphingomicrobium sp.]